MKSIRNLHFLIILLVIAILLTTPIEGTAKWWDKFGEPKYGGTITLRVNETSSFVLDPYKAPSFAATQLWYDYLFANDWTVDPDTYPFKADFTPEEYISGSLAESWEFPDPVTIVVHIRKGVHWHNKAPVNGRELTADDVAHHYNRLAGTGHGFSVPSMFYSYAIKNMQGATATDKYTVTFKYKKPTLTSFGYLRNPGQLSNIEAPEWVALAGPPPKPAPGGQKKGPPPPPPGGGGSALSGGGPLNDWHTVVGSGPWMLTSFVDGSAIKYVKNPDYWAYDERHPKNRLPYADKLDVLCIPDSATALAALRTKKLDLLTSVDWRQAQSLKKTNPDLQQVMIPEAGVGMLCNLNNPPFTDIRVRKALQLAVDMNTIAKTHYGGFIDGIPCGSITPALTDYAFLYKDWPQSLKDEYSYNPDKAKQLLAEAGFPDGFKTSCICSTTHDLTLLQIIKSMFMDAGVDMEIQTLEMASYTQYIMTAKHKAMAGPEPGGTARTGMPWFTLLGNSSLFINPTTIKDPVYDGMCNEVLAETDPIKFKQMIRDADRYMLEHHYSIMAAPKTGSFTIWRPELKGYSGENLDNLAYYARWWKE